MLFPYYEPTGLLRLLSYWGEDAGGVIEKGRLSRKGKMISKATAAHAFLLTVIFLNPICQTVDVLSKINLSFRMQVTTVTFVM